MCHDVYLIYREEQIYDKEYYILIQPFFQFCGCKKKRNAESCDQSFSSKTSLPKKKTCHYDQIELDTSKEIGKTSDINVSCLEIH